MSAAASRGRVPRVRLARAVRAARAARGSALPALPRRKADSHKGDFGRVLVVAGSHGMVGAGVLAARAALRSGAGLVTLALPAEFAPAATAACPEATQILLPSADRPLGSSVRESFVGRLRSGFEVLAIGPGLGLGPRARSLLALALGTFDGPQVIDADALNLLALHPELLGLPRPDRVFTPHPGEFARLAGTRPRGRSARLEGAAGLARRLGGVVVLKGHETVISDGQRWRVNSTGNPGMATGGAGDVLTGVVAAFLAQGLPAYEAAVLAAHVHGLAGDLVAARRGETGIVAGDIVEGLPEAIRSGRSRRAGKP